MFRVGLTIVLTALLALPHGVCFCEFVQAAPAQEEVRCPCENPLTQEASPSEPEEDHEKDCPCKLREVMAAQQLAEFDAGHVVLWTDSAGGSSLFTPLPGQSLKPNLDESAVASLVSPIPCALRL